MIKQEINIDYIGYITNRNGIAEYEECEIEDHFEIVDKLKEWESCGIVSVPIARAVYKDLFPHEFWWQGYCMDNEYGDVEYNVITDPLDVLDQYKIKRRKKVEKIDQEYRELKQELLKEKKYDRIKFENDKSQEIKLADEELTERYVEKFITAVENSMAAINYEMTLHKLKSDPHVVAYSSDQKGWSRFNFLKISDDVGVKVKTNFCYGSSSYFIVTLVYKDINIIPYSYLVTYYNARSVDIIPGTRNFPRRRSSWRPALEYAVDCANLARKNPQKFIREFIMSEVTELVSKLEGLVSNPKEMIGKMVKIKRSDDSEMSLNHLNYSGMGLERMLIDESELPIAVMALKVTDSIRYIESLKALSVDFKFLNKYIKKIVELNISILDQVEATKYSVEQTLAVYEKEVSKVQRKIIKNDRLCQPYIDELKTLSHRVRSKRIREEMEEDYIREHPNYQKLIADNDDFQMELTNAKARLVRRQAFVRILSEFIDKISDLLN